MAFETVAIATLAGGIANEDRAGTAHAHAWVIDGATDVLEAPLTKSASDAAWFAEAMHEELQAFAAERCFALEALPARIAAAIAPRFARAARRAPASPDEQPSAAAIVVRIEGLNLSYVSLGDCTLIAETEDRRLVHIGDGVEKAGDRWVADVIEHQRAANPSADPVPFRAELWPRLRAARRMMNHHDGYGIFSVTAPPPPHIRTGTIALEPYARILIATDGFMRLSDVFRRYSYHELFEAAWQRGLDALMDELRALEHADEACLAFPRAKVSDDATALLLRLR